MAFSLDSNFNYQSAGAFQYNPASNVLKVGTVQGNVSGNSTSASVGKALQIYDGSNKAINSTFHWVGEDGQPTWLWGSNDGTNQYVYNPANFHVAYANSAGSASSVAWGNVSGKPSTFAPSAHSHSWDATTGKPTGIVKVASWDGSTLSLTTVT